MAALRKGRAMDMTDYATPWYHGSPHRLTILRKGSWITQFREVAEAFSHKPSIISMSDDCQRVSHNGAFPGFLYSIAEPMGPGDVTVLPDTAGTHWQTQRDLSIELIEELPVSQPPLLTAKQIEELRKIHPDAGKATGFFSAPREQAGEERGC